MKRTDEGINEALEKVRELVEQVVRAEQLRDQLTELPNDAALVSALGAFIERAATFWMAFVEIDHFKRINEEFGYDAADGYLKKVASHLQGSRDYFPRGTIAFRAHGDEFFLLGELHAYEPAEIHESLDALRLQISRVRVPVQGKQNPLSGTVSVGWACSTDAGDTRITSRSFRVLLEQAVGAAKRSGRNNVVRYDESVKKQQVRGIRDNCGACNSSFSVDVPTTDVRVDALFCPNCGERIERPPPPMPPAGAIKLKAESSAAS